MSHRFRAFQEKLWPLLLKKTFHQLAHGILFFVPKGQMKIARGFNRGLKIQTDQAPQGRQKAGKLFYRPCGTWPF
jgi:hypothetical protein